MSGEEESNAGEAAPGPSSESSEARAEPEDAKPASSSFSRERRRLVQYLSVLDFARLPDTRLGWLVRVAATVIALGALYRRVDAATALLRHARPPATIPTGEVDGVAFELPEATRRAIFADLATAEVAERARAIQQNTWNGHLWSREDDRGYYERVAARSAAMRHRVSLSQVYLVLDEGIRKHWPAPNGEPLPATTPPLNTRQSW